MKKNNADKMPLVLQKLKSTAPGWILSLQGLSHFKILESLSQLFFGKKKVQLNEIYHRVCIKGMNEEDRAKLKLKERELDIEELRQQNQALQTLASDRQNARRREKAGRKGRDPFVRALAATIFLGFFGMLSCLALFPVAEDKEVYLEAMRFMGECVICVSSYYFGSCGGILKAFKSKSFKKKD